MRKIILTFFMTFLLIQLNAAKKFNFAFFTDTHIDGHKQQPIEDLQNAVAEVDKNKSIDFVLVSGDLTQSADTMSFRIVKQLLDQLDVPYYVLPGNHDVNKKDTSLVLDNYEKYFPKNNFAFVHDSVLFLSFKTLPVKRYGEGVIQPKEINFLKTELEKAGKNIPVFAVTHYPLQNGVVKNWYDVTDLMRKYNTQAILCGHVHRNLIFNYDEIPGIVLRTNMRSDKGPAGYTIFTISDKIVVAEKRIGQPAETWFELPLGKRTYDSPNLTLRSKK